MAIHENVTLQSCKVRITSGVAGATVDRFVVHETTAGRIDEVINYVPPAAGGVPDGILGMKPDIPRGIGDGTPYSGTVVTSYVRGDGCEAVIELGEAVTIGTTTNWLRVGGNASEVKGAAYLADATGDVRVAKALESGAVGQKIRIQYLGFSGTTP